MHKNIEMLHNNGWVEYLHKHYNKDLTNLILDLSTCLEKDHLWECLEIYNKARKNKPVDKTEEDIKIDDVRVGNIKIDKTGVPVNETWGGDDYWTEEKPMAKLSERKHIEYVSTGKPTQNNIEIKEENIMSKLRTVNITLIDENPNLKGSKKVVFQEMGVVTEYNDQETKMNVIASGKVAKALKVHNTEVRAETIDKAVQRTTGRDVPLEPIELLSDGELTWSIIQIA